MCFKLLELSLSITQRIDPYQALSVLDSRATPVYLVTYCLDKAYLLFMGASLVAQMIKNLPAEQETGFDPWSRRIPWRREWLATAVFLPAEFHGQGSLVGYSSWGCRVGHIWVTNTHTCYGTISQTHYQTKCKSHMALFHWVLWERHKTNTLFGEHACICLKYSTTKIRSQNT